MKNLNSYIYMLVNRKATGFSQLNDWQKKWDLVSDQNGTF